jgi:hypothetical protein
MNIKRLLLAIAAGFVITYATDFLVHGVWLRPDYLAAQSLWRPAEEMRTVQHWIFLAQLIGVATFVIVWAKGFAGRGLAMGIVFGLLMGMSQQIWAIINYVALPVPGALAAKWFLGGRASASFAGYSRHRTIRPMTRREAVETATVPPRDSPA